MSVQTVVSWDDLTAAEHEICLSMSQKFKDPRRQQEVAVHEGCHKFFSDRGGIDSEYKTGYCLRDSVLGVAYIPGEVRPRNFKIGLAIATMNWPMVLNYMKSGIAPLVAFSNEELRKMLGFEDNQRQFDGDVEMFNDVICLANSGRPGEGYRLGNQARLDLRQELSDEPIQSGILAEAKRAKKILFGSI
jgi:hypothetical protein